MDLEGGSEFRSGGMVKEGLKVSHRWVRYKDKNDGAQSGRSRDAFLFAATSSGFRMESLESQLTSS